MPVDLWRHATVAHRDDNRNKTYWRNEIPAAVLADPDKAELVEAVKDLTYFWDSDEGNAAYAFIVASTRGVHLCSAGDVSYAITPWGFTKFKRGILTGIAHIFEVVEAMVRYKEIQPDQIVPYIRNELDRNASHAVERLQPG